ncbi:MAG: DUF2909 domain-containing protein [Rhodoferax sp.]
MLTRILILATLALILVSLFGALSMILRKQGQNKRMVQALTLRIGLSIGLFVVLMVGFYFGFIPQHGLK